MKRLTFLTVLLVVALGLSACSPEAGGQASATPKSGTATPRATVTATARPTLAVDAYGMINLTIQVWHALQGGSEQALIERTEAFNASNEWRIRVELVKAGDGNMLRQAVAAAERLPEVVVALPEQALTWDEEGLVVDVSAYVFDANWGLETEAWEDIPALYRGQDMVDGRMLGVPAERTSRFLFYNTTWARELGFEGAPADSEAFREQACAANATFRQDANPQDDGYGGWIVDTDWMGLYAWLLAFGGGVVEDGEYAFQRPENEAALTFLKELREDGCAWVTADPLNPYAQDPNTHYEQFARRLALFIDGDLTEREALAAALAQAGSQDAWAMIPYPGTEGQAVIAYGPAYTLFESSAEGQLAAWLFVRWMLTVESQAAWVTASGTLPLRGEALGLLDGYAQSAPQWAQAVAAMEVAQGVPQEATWRTVRHVLEDGTLSLFRLNLGVEAIPDLLDEMETTAQELAGGE